MKFDRAIALLGFVGAVVHEGNARQVRMTGDAKAAAEHEAVAEEFRAAIEALKTIGEFEETTQKMKEEEKKTR